MIVAIGAGMVLRIAIGVAAMVVLWRLGIGVIRMLAQPAVPPAEPGQLRKVNVRYRCDICGLELKMTLAPDEDPPAPNHCLDEMVIVAPAYD